MENKKGSFLGATIAEILVLVILVILIVSTLNYFGIIRLSQSLPFLSFLPQQTQVSNQLQKRDSNVNAMQNGKTIVRSIVKADGPQVLENTGSSTLYKFIATSSAKFTRETRIDLELSVNNMSSPSGIFFNNGLEYGDKNYKALRVFRADSNKNWLLEYRSQNKSTYTILAKAASRNEFKKFALLISQNGKTVTILSPGLQQKVLNLSDTFYDADRQMRAHAQVAPQSTLTIYSLSYQY